MSYYSPISSRFATVIAAGVAWCCVITAIAAPLGSRSTFARPAACQSGFGQFFKDEVTTLKVVAKLQFNMQLLREAVDVKTNGGIVTLSGNVSSTELIQLAGTLAAEVNGVIKVNNFLQVGPPLPRNAPGT